MRNFNKNRISQTKQSFSEDLWMIIIIITIFKEKEEIWILIFENQYFCEYESISLVDLFTE
jgi:hypothetical protein